MARCKLLLRKTCSMKLVEKGITILKKVDHRRRSAGARAAARGRTSAGVSVAGGGSMSQQAQRAGGSGEHNLGGWQAGCSNTCEPPAADTCCMEALSTAVACRSGPARPPRLAAVCAGGLGGEHGTPAGRGEGGGDRGPKARSRVGAGAGQGAACSSLEHKAFALRSEEGVQHTWTLQSCMRWNLAGHTCTRYALRTASQPPLSHAGAACEARAACTAHTACTARTGSRSPGCCRL